MRNFLDKILNIDKMDEVTMDILRLAIEREKQQRYVDALVCYQEGTEKLLTFMKTLPADSPKKQQLRTQASQYLERAERLKAHLNEEKRKGKYHEQIRIANQSTGNSYAKLFTNYFADGDNSGVFIEDPYIRSHHQIQNLVRFCELLVKLCCPKLKTIHLKTTLESNENDCNRQRKQLGQLRDSLQKSHSVELTINYSDSLHDREIRCSNGWVIKIGRGLDYFKAPDSPFAIGSFDMDLRSCHETVVDVYFKSS